MSESQIIRSALVAYSTEQMYLLVNDVASYPQFLPWCKRSSILESGTDWMEVELAVQKGPIEQCFTTRNSGIANKSIQMELVNGPFKKLYGEWLFNVLNATSCKIEFTLAFEIGASPMALFLKPLFNQIATSMVEAFHQRAKAVYG